MLRTKDLFVNICKMDITNNTLITNCIIIGIIITCIYSYKIKVEHKITIDGITSIYSIVSRV